MARRAPRPLIEALYRISSLAGRLTDPREAMEVVLAEVLAATGGDSGSIGLINPDTGLLEAEVQQGFSCDSGEAALKPGEGITGWVALHGKPALVRDVSADSRYRKLVETVRSEMAAPIEDGGQIIGVINVNSDRTGAFGADHLESLLALSAEAARLLRQLWLVERLQTKAGHLEAVLTVGKGLVSRMVPEEILHSITREAAVMSGCQVCTIHLLGEDPDEPGLQAVAGHPTRPAHPDLPVEESSAGIALLRRKQVEVADVRKTEVFLPLLQVAQRDRLVSLLCTPIAFEEKVLGVLSAYTVTPHRFSNDERKLFEALAGLGAVAIHNARLYARVFEREEMLRRSEKLTTLGLLAAEIAHEIRNPLTVVKLLYQALDLEFPAGDPRQKDTRIIEEKLDQLESIVGRVLSFARPPDGPHSTWTMAEIVEDALLLTRLKLEQAGVEVLFRPDPGALSVFGNKGQFQQVLLNLLLNSMQAMEDGGRIELRTGSEPRADQRGVYLEIADSGSGIPPDLQPVIFEPLLTGQQEGTGLGLGIVKRIVEAHRGEIHLVRTGPAGTVMKIWLPAAE